MSEAPSQMQPDTDRSADDVLPADTGRHSAIKTALNALLPSGRVLPVAGPTAAVHWLVPGGLLIGLFYVGLYRASWRIFGEVGTVRLMPALAVWLADVSLFGLTMTLAAARTIDRWPAITLEPTDRSYRAMAVPGAVALMICLMSKLVLWTAIPEGVAGWPADWRRHLNFLYPWPVFRPLILAPMWGRWALMLAAGVGRMAPDHGPPAVGLSAKHPLVTTLGWFAVVMVLTAIYCGRQRQWMIGCIISLVVLGTTFVFAVVTARRFLGRTSFTVHGAAFVAEVTFLLAYLAFSQHIYRY